MKINSLGLDLHLLELVLQLGGEADPGVLGGQLLHRRVRHHRSRVLARHVVRDEGVVGAAGVINRVKLLEFMASYSFWVIGFTLV